MIGCICMGFRVLVFGTFDIIHPAHVIFLKEARKLGEEGGELIVVVALDSSVVKEKGKPPIFSAEERRFLVQALKPVNQAYLGYEDDRLRIIEELKPDLIALGYDQKVDESILKKELARRGVDVEIIRLKRYGDIKSSKIKRMVVERFKK